MTGGEGVATPCGSCSSGQEEGCPSPPAHLCFLPPQAICGGVLLHEPSSPSAMPVGIGRHLPLPNCCHTDVIWFRTAAFYCLLHQLPGSSAVGRIMHYLLVWLDTFFYHAFCCCFYLLFPRRNWTILVEEGAFYWLVAFCNPSLPAIPQHYPRLFLPTYTYNLPWRGSVPAYHYSLVYLPRIRVPLVCSIYLQTADSDIHMPYSVLFYRPIAITAPPGLWIPT